MAVIVVNGTSIQTAINAAQVGDTLDVRAGGYAGFDVTKKVTIIGTGAARIQSPVSQGNVIQVKANGAELRGLDVSGATGQFGSCVTPINVTDVILDHLVCHDTEAGHGIRGYGAGVLRLKIIAPTIHHVAIGIRFDFGGAGSVIDDPVIYDIDRMIVNDPTAGNDTGAMAFVGHKNTGPITVNRPMLSRAYSVPRGGKPASYDYGVDGAFFEMWGGAKGWTVNGGELRGSPVVMESGKGSADPDCGDFNMKGVKVWGRQSTVTEDPLLVSIGLLYRSMAGSVIEDCEFRDFDHHTVLLESTGNYSGTVSGVRFERNKVWLKTNTRLVTLGQNVPMTALTMNNNQVYPAPGIAAVASVLGKGTTNDKATLTAWTGWEANSYWGPEVVTPPPPPVDPCLSIKAERDAALAQLATANASLSAANAALAVANGKVSTLTTERDAAVAKLAQAKALAAQITAL